MDVIALTSDRERDWQRFVESSPQASLAHLIGWRNVVEKSYHHAPHYLMAVDSDNVSGILPLFFIASPFFGRFLVTAPYLSYGGVLAASERAARALIEAARRIAAGQRAKYIEIRGLCKIGQGLLLKDKYCTFSLPLGPGADALWRKFEGGRARTTIRKALKSDLVVERGNHLVPIFADIMSRHMRDLGTPSHRLRFYQCIVEEFPHHSEILLARNHDCYLAGMLLLSCGETVHWLQGAALKEFHTLAPTSLLVWEAIRLYCERGLKYFDFGRSRWDSGTFFFKRQWGAQPLPLFYEYHLAARERLPDVDPTNPSFHWATTLWKRLPVFVAKALGPFIIRDIP